MGKRGPAKGAMPTSTSRFGNGRGHGGPANGAGNGKERPAFEPGNTAKASAVRDPEVIARRQMSEEERRQRYEALFEDALTATETAMRRAAAALEKANDEKLVATLVGAVNAAATTVMDRTKGKAPQANLNVNVNDVGDLDDGAVDARIAQLLGKARTSPTSH